MNFTNKIVNRLNNWMNFYPDSNQYLDIYFQYEARNIDNSIHIYHANSNQLIAILDNKLNIEIIDIDYVNEEVEPFILQQYTRTLLKRIISTI